MPHSQTTARGILALVLAMLLTTLALTLPHDVLAGYDIDISGDAPGGDGQPDDIGNAPRPGILASVKQLVVLLQQWMHVLASHLGLGGLLG